MNNYIPGSATQFYENSKRYRRTSNSSKQFKNLKQKSSNQNKKNISEISVQKISPLLHTFSTLSYLILMEASKYGVQSPKYFHVQRLELGKLET